MKTYLGQHSHQDGVRLCWTDLSTCFPEEQLLKLILGLQLTNTPRTGRHSMDGRGLLSPVALLVSGMDKKAQQHLAIGRQVTIGICNRIASGVHSKVWKAR